MEFLTLISQSRSLSINPNLRILSSPNVSSTFIPKDVPYFKTQFLKLTGMATRNVIVSAAMTEKPWKRYTGGEAKGFVDEMRLVAMKLHTRQQAQEGEMEAKAPEEQRVEEWEPTFDGYLKFLVDIKVVYDTLEQIIEKPSFPSYGEFRNTGLERSEKLAKDLKWFEEKGYGVPEASSPGVAYAKYLKQLSEKDPQAFICHFYNIYFANTAGGRIIAKKVAEKILDSRELEFYKWDGELSQLLQNVRDKLNKVAENWSREDKNRCLGETEISFKFYREIVRLMLS
ncbi:hypothetical protein Goshw_026734 [Gossypium schwendimanii]|uniref:heme oxygenase (biliverdin-producing) n=1 Tax=Gossypium schwendimanii TaxID=34291 RepID=A0A7J9M7X5_GOSSC|nr:hypothetical protein [Gossypium schwendimanii]